MHPASIENPQLRQDQILKRLMAGLVLLMLLMPVCLYFDLAVATRVDYHALSGDVRTLLSCAEVFGHSYGVALILAAIWFAAPLRRRQIGGLVVLLMFNSIATGILKNVLMRTRPRGGQAAQFDSVWETFRGWHPAITQFDFSLVASSNWQSYPSGHAATALILGVGLAVIFPGARYLFLVFSLLACGQRIGFQAHYLSDVCAGMILALVLFSLFLTTSHGRQSLLGSDLHSLKLLPESLAREPADVDSQWEEPQPSRAA